MLKSCRTLDVDRYVEKLENERRGTRYDLEERVGED